MTYATMDDVPAVMTVETVRDHDNDYGDKPGKAKGDRYDVPGRVGQGLVANGLVKDVTPKPAKASEPVKG